MSHVALRALRRALTRAAQLWDLGGQSRFRSMWERYCRGVNAIVYAPARRTALHAPGLQSGVAGAPPLHPEVLVKVDRGVLLGF